MAFGSYFEAGSAYPHGGPQCGPGKTTILYRLELGEVTTIPTTFDQPFNVGTLPTIAEQWYNVERVRYKNLTFTCWDGESRS